MAAATYCIEGLGLVRVETLDAAPVERRRKLGSKFCRQRCVDGR